MEIPQQILWYKDPNWWLVFAAYITIFGSILAAIIHYRKTINSFFSRIRLKYFPVQFNLAISFKTSKTGKNSSYNSEIKKQLLQLIEYYHLGKEIRIKDFQDIFHFENLESAQDFCKRKNLDLIVWGSYSEEGLKDKDGHNFSELALNFTYLHPNDKKGNLGKMVGLELQSILALKSYRKIIDSSIEDIKIISENIFDTCTYILGLTLKLFGRIQQSITLLETVFPKNTNKTDAFANGIRFHLINDYQLLIDESYRQNNYERGFLFSQKILHIEPKNFSGLANTAVFAYKMGNITESEKKIADLEKFYPGHPLTLIDVAFYKITKKDYKSAQKIYEKIAKIQGTPNHCNIIDVIDFLESQYDSNPKEPGFLYASGILNHYFADRYRAKNPLKKFLKSSDKRTYRRMRQHAKRILEEKN